MPGLDASGWQGIGDGEEACADHSRKQSARTEANAGEMEGVADERDFGGGRVLAAPASQRLDFRERAEAADGNFFKRNVFRGEGDKEMALRRRNGLRGGEKIDGMGKRKLRETADFETTDAEQQQRSKALAKEVKSEELAPALASEDEEDAGVCSGGDGSLFRLGSRVMIARRESGEARETKLSVARVGGDRGKLCGFERPASSREASPTDRAELARRQKLPAAEEAR